VGVELWKRMYLDEGFQRKDKEVRAILFRWLDVADSINVVKICNSKRNGDCD
jgi:hypothetical protein